MWAFVCVYVCVHVRGSIIWTVGIKETDKYSIAQTILFYVVQSAEEPIFSPESLKALSNEVANKLLLNGTVE